MKLDMKIFDDRPYVICHLLSSVDGRISGNFFKTQSTKLSLSLYSDIRKNYDCEAVISGAVTCAKIYSDGFVTDLPKTQKKYIREDYIVKTNLKNYVVCVDIEGRLKWISNEINRPNQPKSHIIEILTESISDDYLEYLQQMQISYIFAGKDKLDIELALQKLKKNFGINSIMLTGGGVLDWSFVKVGMIDELSIILAPVVDAEKGIATIFDDSSYLSDKKAVELSLYSVDKLENNTVWLRYRK